VRRFGVYIAVCVAGVVAVPPCAAQSGPVSTVLDESASPEARAEAARSVLDRIDRSATLEIWVPLLRADAPASSTRDLLLGVLAKHPDPPADLLPHLHLALERTDADAGWLRPLIAVGGAYHDRRTARQLLAFTEPGTGLETVAFAALARCAARDDLGTDRSAWTAWLDQCDALSDAEWEAGLIGRLSRQRDALGAQRDALLARLVTTVRKLALSIDPDQRGAMVATLLLDSEPELRAVGFELANRELAEARPLGEPVAQAAMRLLAGNNATTRARAAELLNQIASPDARPAITAALVREEDESAARAMLLASSRWPDADAEPAVLRWIDVDSTRSAASGLAWALQRAGLLSDDAGRRVAEALVSLPPESLDPTMCKLLVRLGGEAGQSVVVGLLGVPEARQAAADALTASPDTLDPLIDAARSDSSLYAFAVAGIIAHRPDAEGFRLLTALPAPSVEASSTARRDLAGRMTLADRVTLAEELSDPGVIEDLLASAVVPDAEPESPTLDRARTLLAGVRLATGNPGGALESLGEPQEAETPEAVRVRTVALILLDRLDEAAETDADAEAWFEALRMAPPEDAKAIAKRMRSRFELDEEQSARLDALSPRVEVEDEPPPP